ncbi:cell division protein Fic [Litchfieldella qijiaojingensis]|uniref:Cell division protein Fic n=1 Tax=Litchfieldella qijiaojingensis TaxID=980347 RepID=A0ABQ2ZCU7_9GAMM|nr:Fic family protein [Halomonas qijiaojingensis]GGY09690.1 cell division protein Fic [Halomonas qijiaojingensis]
MTPVGYEYLRQTLNLSAFQPELPAQVRPVTRITRLSDCLAVPPHRAPRDEALAHLLFALKHEGVNLAILAEALPKLDPDGLLEALREAPNGVYLRKLGFLHEAFTGQLLDYQPEVRGRAVSLFDPRQYVTGLNRRDSRWRIDFNGLGSLRWCATVRRTAEIDRLLAEDVLTKAIDFIDSLPAEMLDRAMQWAYLSETQSSFAIEREAPSADKQQRFVQLLHQAHEPRELDESYLVQLQNTTLDNPFDKAYGFRDEQNFLHNGLRGAIGVSYLPPPPELCRELMAELIEFANNAPGHVHPLVAAAVTSFGFVLLHPFMDGNGRISRFLVHQQLCQSGMLKKGLLLPVSVAMKRHESEYLAALVMFSRPARERWHVNWIDAEHHDFEFVGSDAIYRYWDATPAVEFLLRMAQTALETDLKEETRYLHHFDQVYRAVDERFDIRGSDLARLVMMCLSHDGRLSKNRRKQFRYQVPEEAMDFLEQQAQRVMREA